MRRFVALLVLLAALVIASLALADTVSVSSSIEDGSTLKGCVRWDVTVSPGQLAAGVRYLFDDETTASGDLVSSSSSSDSYRYGDFFHSGWFDTRFAYNGLHQLSVVAFDANGSEVGRQDETVKVGTGNKNCPNRLK